jgi:hypothetical protein
MNDRTRAYYDVPAASGPSANFANRPITDISNLLSVDEPFMISSSCSSSLSDKEDKPGSRHDVAPESPTTPTIKVPFPNEEQRPRGRSMSNDEDVADRPRLRKKSATAPPGSMAMSEPGYAPQPPRRAISARVKKTQDIQGKSLQQQTYWMKPLPARTVQQSEHGKLPPHSPRVPRARPPRREGLGRMSSQVTIRAPNPGSFSQKERVRRTLDGKNFGRLDTSIVDFESRGLLSSPTSMQNTPRELYPIPERRSADHAQWRVGPSSPHSVDARRSILSTLSPRSQQSYRVRSRKKGNKRYRQAEKQQNYVPGPVRLEGHPAQLRKGSVANLERFDERTTTRGKRYSDMIVLNSMTMYFAELSVLEDASEECLDRYWRDTKPPVLRHVVKPSVSSVEEIRIGESPRRPSITSTTSTTRGSRFSSSSASSSSTTTPMRQRDRLKRLLTPGFTSSGKWIS